MTNQAANEVSEPPVSDAAASFPIVGVGASAGGLEAFTQFLKALPADTGMAFVLVQHLAPTHISALAEILSRATSMSVTEVAGESTVEPNHVYVIPPGQSMVIVDGALQLLPREGAGIHRPVDQFFRSLAEDRRHEAIGVVLSGTATDGTLGLEAIRAEGGVTFAQDATAQHDGMPQSAIDSGSVDFVLSPVEIAREIVRIGHHSGTTPATAQESDTKADLTAILQILHESTGVDFTHYKFNTLYRRVTRRIVSRKLDGLSEYEQFLRQTPAEVEILFQDILINVTSFFRDPASLEAIKSTVFPRLLAGRSRHDAVRIWTMGCSTGQEAYSLAMIFAEVTEAAEQATPLQLFATDVNPAVIEKARSGLYPKDIALDISPQRLRRFFIEEDGGYRISKSIRDACVFSRHNVLGDPPFSRIDLISCRNLLIYLEPTLQQRILPTLHYALKPTGFLWLGGSESIGAFANLFEVEDAKHKIYSRKPGSNADRGQFPLRRAGEPQPPFLPLPARSSEAGDMPREADRVLLTKFAPPSVLVTGDLEIMQYRGDTGPYLAPVPGKASLNLLKMLREGLLAGVRNAVQRARNGEANVRETGLRVKSNGIPLDVSIEVIAIASHGSADKGFLILFESDQQQSRGETPSVAESQEPGVAATSELARLADELAATRDYLQSVIEQQESAYEELQSANEEVQSANEELQSANEELETSKEEIQSSNEELATVNDELTNRIAESNGVNTDLVNLIGSVQMAIIILGPDLRVRRFTPLAERLLKLIPTDVGRPLADIKLNLDNLPDLEPQLMQVLATEAAQEYHVRDKAGQWFALRLHPYRTLDNKIDGVVVMLVDLDMLKRAHDYTESIVATVHEPLLVLDAELLVRTASRSFYETFRVSPGETEGKLLEELGNRQWDIPRLRGLLQQILQQDTQFDGFEVEHDFERLGKRTMLLNARRLLQIDGPSPSILLAIEDITERNRLEMAQQVSELRYRRLFETAKDGILILDANSQKIIHVNPFLMELLDLPADQFLGRELWEIGLLRDKQASLAAMQQLAERGSIRYESLPLEDRHGGLHPVEMVANVYDEGLKKVIQCNIRDISERSRLESLLRGQSAQLSELHRRKDEFLAMLSHELRSPLAPISNALYVLGLNQDGETQVHHQARDIIQRQLRQLEHLVDDLLEVSRITTGRIQLRRAMVDINTIAQDAAETVRPLINQRHHELKVSLPSAPTWLNADSARLEQVIVNLLTNAAKYTEENGEISLTVEVEPGGDPESTPESEFPEHESKIREFPLPRQDSVVIRVRDTGVGIAPDLLPHIFDLFTQAERSLDRSQGGLGIGLALVQSLTELHEGKVEVASTLGQGSEFVVRLPAGPTEAQPQTKPNAISATPVLRPLRVLVVDDNVDTALSLSLLLEAFDHEVRTAHDGLSGIQTALEFHPDVALLDIGLPGLNGYEVAKRIRQEPTLAKIMLVALTGYGHASDRQTSLEAGFNQHLVKPVELSKLQQIMTLATQQQLTAT